MMPSGLWNWQPEYQAEERDYSWPLWTGNPQRGIRYLAGKWDETILLVSWHLAEGPKLALSWQLRSWSTFKSEWEPIDVPAVFIPFVEGYIEHLLHIPKEIYLAP